MFLSHIDISFSPPPPQGSMEHVLRVKTKKILKKNNNKKINPKNHQGMNECMPARMRGRRKEKRGRKNLDKCWSRK